MRENRTSGVMREGVAGLNGPSPLLYRDLRFLRVTVGTVVFRKSPHNAAVMVYFPLVWHAPEAPWTCRL